MYYIAIEGGVAAAESLAMNLITLRPLCLGLLLQLPSCDRNVRSTQWAAAAVIAELDIKAS